MTTRHARRALASLAVLAALVTAGLVSASDEFCRCANEGISNEAEAQACGALMEGLSDYEIAERTMRCRAEMPVPDGGPDLCFCMKTMSSDPEIRTACDAILDELPEDMDQVQMFSLIQRCAT